MRYFIAIWCIIFIVFLMFEGEMCSSSYCLIYGYVLVDSYSCSNDNDNDDDNWYYREEHDCICSH